MIKNKIRAACFSHSESFIVHKETKDHYQIIAKLTEVENEDFNVEITAFNTTSVITESSEKSFNNISSSMEWIVSIFDAFLPFGPPEVLYLPEWRDEKEIDECFKKWADGLFGLQYLKAIENPVNHDKSDLKKLDK